MWGYNYTPMSDELYHWKYIKREKINGKYRYWYADTEKSKKSNKIRFGKYLYTRDKNTGRNVLTKKDRRKQDFENFIGGIQYKLGYNERAEYQDAKKKYNNGEALTPEEKKKLTDAYTIYTDGRKQGTKEYEDAEKTVYKLQGKSNNYKVSPADKEKYENAAKKYFSTPMGKIEKTTTNIKSSVKRTYDNVKGNINTAVENGKEFIEYLLTKRRR